jgi:hypothetical protein
VTVVVKCRYYGFTAPTNMGLYDVYGLNYGVNTVAGGRNVPFKWEVYDNLSGIELTAPGSVQIQFMSYTAFRTQFGSLTGRAVLPAGNPCADGTRISKLVSSTTGATTAVKYDGDKFNVGVKMPTKPAKAADNCFVAYTQVVGDIDPGIVSLFVLT